MNKEDGGPAFPDTAIEHPSGWCSSSGITGHSGMTLRDYFAAAALTGSREGLPPHQIAASCYNIADAMLSARSK